MNPNILKFDKYPRPPHLFRAVIFIFFSLKNVTVVSFPSYCSHFFQYYLDPPIKLNEALERYGLKKDDFFLLRHGESRNLNKNEN